jgi:FkbM family methyltransferase
MNLKLVKSKFVAFFDILKGHGRPSFSQIGEDSILYYLFSVRNVYNPTYLDIGTNDPVKGNNTYFFYHRGASGVCIEPDPVIYKRLKKKRPRDICLNFGIGLNEVSEAPFYVFPEKYTGWNTFSATEAELRKAAGHEYEKIIQIPLKNVNNIIQDTLGKAPDFISIDVEGLDLEILESLDFDKYAPNVLIVETIRFGDTAQANKQQNIIDFVCSKGYLIYADTYVNTIFIKSGF